MKQKTLLQRVGDFMEGKGFYIVLFLCVSAIGVSGYYLFSGLLPDHKASQSVTGSAQVQVTPPVSPVKPKEQTPPPPATPAPVATPKAKAAAYTWPVRGEVSRDFSLEVFAYDETMGDWRTHQGLDLNAELGCEVLAISDGTVKSITDDALLGTTVLIEHGEGIESVYANLAALPTVKEGAVVTTGAVIGAVGNTAISESTLASHLHFEIRQDGVSIDPLQFLPQS
ncbi:MAG: M23 family metallopeptidase [Evtepia sp.]